MGARLTLVKPVLRVFYTFPQYVHKISIIFTCMGSLLPDIDNIFTIVPTICANVSKTIFSSYFCKINSFPDLASMGYLLYHGVFLRKRVPAAVGRCLRRVRVLKISCISE